MVSKILPWAALFFALYSQIQAKSTPEIVLRLQTSKGFCYFDQRNRPLLPSPVSPENVLKNIRSNDAIIDNPTAILALAGAGLCRSYMYQQDFVRTPIVVSACLVSLGAMAFKLYRAVANEFKINTLNSTVFAFAKSKETTVTFSQELLQPLFLAQNLEETCAKNYSVFQYGTFERERGRP